MPHALAWPSLDIDYPSHGESVAARDGSFRIGAPEDAAFVEVSIDRGPWHPCRHSCGYWWYDWASMPSGPHDISARGALHDGMSFGSTPRHFTVTAPPLRRKHTGRGRASRK